MKTVPLPASTAAAPRDAGRRADGRAEAAARAASRRQPVEPRPARRSPSAAAKRREPPKPRRARRAGGERPAVQLGAFSSEAKAQAAWKDSPAASRRCARCRTASRWPKSGGKKLYRLRAPAGSSGKASAVCRALSSAKEACAVIG